jgi:hypothetical protein
VRIEHTRFGSVEASAATLRSVHVDGSELLAAHLGVRVE